MNKYLSIMQRMLLVLVGFVSASYVSAYDFKVANGDGVTIYYNINGNDVTVTSGDQKYEGDVRIPATVMNEDASYNVTAIGKEAFNFCQALTSIEIPSSVTTIGDHAFFYCSKLPSVIIPGCVESIGTSAFQHCKNMAAVQLSEGLASIGASAFDGCDKLQTVSIPASVTLIGAGAFSNNDGIASISVELGNTVYDSREDCNAIIETATNTLIQGCKTTTIPNGIVAIGKEAFNFCQTLTSIEIPSSVTAIGEYAFNQCSKLTKVVSKIREPFKIDSSVFTSIPSSAVLYVPLGTKEAYESVGGWGGFADIIELLKTIEFADNSKRTFCSTEALDFSNIEGLSAYIASGFSAIKGEVIMSKVEKVPAQTGLLLVGEPNATYEVPFTETDFVYSNLLVGVTENTDITNVYVFNDETWLFNAVEGSETITAGGAYLNIPVKGEAKPLRMAFTDTTTGISEINDSSGIQDTWHTLQGVRFDGKPAQGGIYIHNGRKVLVK